MCIVGRSRMRSSTFEAVRCHEGGSLPRRVRRCGSGWRGSTCSMRCISRSRARRAGGSSSRKSRVLVIGAHLADPAEKAAKRGRKRRAKTDRADCDLLLRLLTAGELPESWIPPAQILELRTRVRLRKRLVVERSAWQQRLQTQLFHQGVPAGLRPRTRAGREALASVDLSPAGRELVALALRMIETIDRELAPLDRTLSLFARRQPGCRELIARLYGVGSVTATAIVAELGDARRFGCSDDAVRHCGLDVTVHQSDRKRAPGHLSHEGPELLRWALFEAAQQACRSASPDYEYYRQVARRIGHNRACLSVARKLCRRAYHILRELGDEALAPIETPDREEVIAAAA